MGVITHRPALLLPMLGLFHLGSGCRLTPGVQSVPSQHPHFTSSRASGPRDRAQLPQGAEVLVGLGATLKQNLYDRGVSRSPSGMMATYFLLMPTPEGHGPATHSSPTLGPQLGLGPEPRRQPPRLPGMLGGC